MTRIPNRPNSLWLIAACLAVGTVVPLLLGAAGGASTPQENRRTIADMSPAEREELQRKYDEYLALPEAEREKLRRLHAQIESDPEAAQVLEDYQRWLRTLTPWQRLELEREQDWSRRLEIVRRIREEQKDAQQRRRDADRQQHSWFRGMVQMSSIPGFPKLEPDDLARIMNLIKESLPESEARRRLENVDGSRPIYYARILTEALNQAETGAHSDAAFNWPEPLLMERIEEAIRDPSDRFRYNALRRRDDLRQVDPDGRRTLLAVIAHGIDSLDRREAWDAKPSKDDLLRIFQGIKDPDLREQLQNLSAPEREGRLRWFYFGEQRRPFLEAASELSAKLDRLLPVVTAPPGRGTYGYPRRGGSREDDRSSRHRDGERRDDGGSHHRDGTR